MEIGKMYYLPESKKKTELIKFDNSGDPRFYLEDAEQEGWMVDDEGLVPFFMFQAERFEEIK